MHNLESSQTLKEVLAYLKARYSLSLRDSYEIVASVLNSSFAEVPFRMERVLSLSDIKQIKEMAQRVHEHEPLAYVLGYVDFFGCRIHVDHRVLIPRPETELLVEKVLEKAPKSDHLRVLDLCTGSGCIGLALKKQRPSWDVSLSDCSTAAIALAQENAILNQLEVSVYQGDLLAPLEGFESSFDVIVCNPPYICQKEYSNLELSVLEYEPKIALTSGETGLEIYERLACQVLKYLAPKGLLALEIGYNQKESVIKLFSKHTCIKIYCEKDLAGHDRFIFLEVQ